MWQLALARARTDALSLLLRYPSSIRAKLAMASPTLAGFGLAWLALSLLNAKGRHTNPPDKRGLPSLLLLLLLLPLVGGVSPTPGAVGPTSGAADQVISPGPLVLSVTLAVLVTKLVAGLAG